MGTPPAERRVTLRTIQEIVAALIELADADEEAAPRLRRAVRMIQGDPRTARGDAALVDLIDKREWQAIGLAKEILRYHAARWTSVDHKLDAPPARYRGTDRELFWIVLDSRRTGPGDLGRPIGPERIRQIIEKQRSTSKPSDLEARASG